MIALLIYITNIIGLNNNNPVSLGNLASHANHPNHADHVDHVDHVDHADLYILKEPLKIKLRSLNCYFCQKKLNNKKPELANSCPNVFNPVTSPDFIMDAYTDIEFFI